MARSADLTGQRFGRLVAERPLQKRGSGGCVLWLCKCDCGNEHVVTTNALNTGNTKSCGCLAKAKGVRSSHNAANLIGQRFNKLLVIDEIKPTHPGVKQWLCRCDCGNTCVIDTAHLRRGQKSCGCVLTEARRKTGANNLLDLTGSRFGMLLVEARADATNKSHNAYWLCRCDCGNKVVIPGNYLTQNRTSSCGCSHGYRMSRKQRYEEITGEIVPAEHSVIFLDGDDTNWQKENLYHVSNATYLKMYRRQWFSEDADHTLAAIKVCELETAIKIKEQSL